jgi:colanic acid/amylovoran/stewartan biosynthesis glycosyltransferase WcaL/AmsK/CpsK
MNIAFFLTDHFPALSETFVLNQITGLLDRGHDVRIYARRPDAPSPVHPVVERHRLLERTTYWPAQPRPPLLRILKGLWLIVRDPAALPALLRSLDWRRYGRSASSLNLLFWASGFASRRSFDIIYCHFGWNGLHASMLREIGAIRGKLVTVFHGADVSWQLEAFGADVYRPLFEKGDLFLPISEHWKSKLIALGCPEQRVVVHRMGIDCERFAFFERELKPGQAAQLITVGRLVEKKGVEYGIRAVAQLVARRRDVHYTIIGDGPLRASLEELIRHLGLTERVTLMGSRDHDVVRAALNRSHIALAPSVTSQDGDQEGIPVSLMEAMATGMPVVSTTHTGIPELVRDGVSGRLVPERDADALAWALGDLIDHPENWPAMGRAARRQVVEHFDIAALNDRLVALFQGLLR